MNWNCWSLEALECDNERPLPWEHRETLEDGTLALVTELSADALKVLGPRILVLFSGTSSVEREFLRCFPSAEAITLDSVTAWQPIHVADILQWNYQQYPPGYFDVIWASPPCTQYSQARTTGAPPDLVTADAIVQRTLQVISYLQPSHWFIENPRRRYPNALRLRPFMQQLPAPLNRMVDRYGSDCLNESWQGLHVWCQVTSSHLAIIEEVLKKYVEEWRKDPEGTSAVFVLPDLQTHLPRWRKVFRMAGMQIMEVVPTHDDQGEPVQLFESPDGNLHNLPWPVLVVYAPPSRPQVARIRHPRSAHPVLRRGDAVGCRDAPDQQTDTKFVKALKAEYARSGPLQVLRDRVLEAPHGCTRDFRLVGGVL
eukprot:gene17609-biopygen18182